MHNRSATHLNQTQGSVKLLAQLLLVFGLITVFWLPVVLQLSQPNADQIFDGFLISSRCPPTATITGWLPSGSAENSLSLFTPSIPGAIIQNLTCLISRATGQSTLQIYLLVTIWLTALSTFWSCRWLGFQRETSLMTSFLISTAPCAFSRIGHISLVALIPIVPTLVTCVKLRRIMAAESSWRSPICTGLLGAALIVPTQEYYIAFSLLIISSCYALTLLSTSAKRISSKDLSKVAWRGFLLILSFFAMIVMAFLPKLVAATGQGIPSSWSTPRLAVEQFMYGLLPMTWLIPSPWVKPAVLAMQASGLDTGSESYFWSTGSLLIPISWIVALRRLAKPAPLCKEAIQGDGGQRTVPSLLSRHNCRDLALLLCLISALGLLIMSMGGLGTLFAVYISPVLRSLNRFTAFVYGAAVLYLMAEFEQSIQKHA